MKRGVITILGTISCCDREGKNCNKTKRAKYEVGKKLKDALKLKHQNYTNMLPILIESFYPKYDIVPIYTVMKDNKKGSKEVQEEVLRNCEDDRIQNPEKVIEDIFEKGVLIENVNNFQDILKKIDNKINEYDKVIIDLSHGFRHMPILMTIDLIITSLKSESKNKIKHILFAKEIEQNREYKIIDLTEYLELANLAFLINIFRDNYSVSNHVQIKSEKYKRLITLMRKFSKDLMGLSLDNLLEKVVKDLRVELVELAKNEEILFKDEIKEILKVLDEVYTSKKHKYETFYYIAEDVLEKGYLAVAVSLIFEGISYYFYYKFSESPKLKKFYEELSNKELNDYDLLDIGRRVVSSSSSSFKISEKIKKLNLFDDSIKEEFFKRKDKFVSADILNLFMNARDLRNNLLHANSGKKIVNVESEVKKLLKKYKELLIDEKSNSMGNIRIKGF